MYHRFYPYYTLAIKTVSRKSIRFFVSRDERDLSFFDKTELFSCDLLDMLSVLELFALFLQSLLDSFFLFDTLEHFFMLAVCRIDRDRLRNDHDQHITDDKDGCGNPYAPKNFFAVCILFCMPLDILNCFLAFFCLCTFSPPIMFVTFFLFNERSVFPARFFSFSHSEAIFVSA